MPDPRTLPEELRALTRRNALELSDTRWRYDVQRLLEAVTGLLADTSAVRPRPAPPPPAAATGPHHVSPAALVVSSALVAAVAGLAGRAIAEMLRPDRPHGKPARIVDLVVWRGLAWAVVGMAVALWLAVRLHPTEAHGRAVVRGLFLGLLAGAAGAAIYALPRYRPDSKPPEETLNLLLTIEYAFTGAVMGALIASLWHSPRLPLITVGLLAGAVLELVVIASDWTVNSPSERIANVSIGAALIVGFTVAIHALLDGWGARSGHAAATPSG